MTRIDNALLVAALGRLEAEMDLLAAAKLLAVLSKDDRTHLARPRDGFPAAARTLLHAARNKPGLALAANVDPDAVTEILDNLDALAPILVEVTELLKRLEDSRLAWLAEAFGPTLTLYKMARVRAEDDGHLREVVAPLADVLANPAPSRGPTPSEPTEAPEAAPTAPPVDGA